jgi:F-type H+-transporting ATPase subunit alpha
MKKVSGELKLLYSQYRELQAFAQFGSDLDADTKERLALGERIVEVLKQGKNAPVRVGCQVAIVYAVTKGYLNNVAVSGVKEYEKNLFATLENKYGKWLERIESGSFDEADENELRSILAEMQV